MEHVYIHIVRQLYTLMVHIRPRLIRDPRHFCDIHGKLLVLFNENHDLSFEDCMFLSIYLDRLKDRLTLLGENEGIDLDLDLDLDPDENEDINADKRFKLENRLSFFTEHNVYYCLLSIIIIHFKLYNDLYFVNQYYATMTHCKLLILNDMERFIFSQIDWYVNLHVYDEKITQICGESPHRSLSIKESPPLPMSLEEGEQSPLIPMETGTPSISPSVR